MHLLNFAHPLTDPQRSQIEAMLGQPLEQVTYSPIQFDLARAFTDQVSQMLDALNLTSNAWQGTTWLIMPPSLNYITAILLAELHGRIGHFPAIVRLRPSANSLVTTYEVAEIINLEQVRATARTRRT